MDKPKASFGCYAAPDKGSERQQLLLTAYLLSQLKLVFVNSFRYEHHWLYSGRDSVRTVTSTMKINHLRY